jgi:probable addiction module antidote protein
MTLTEKRKDILSEFKDLDIANYLDTPEVMAEFLTECFTEGDADLDLAALSTVARAKGMAEVARRSGLGRESLYKALAPGAQPRFETIRKIIAALDLKVRITV